MKNEKYELITNKQIGAIYWRGQMYFRWSKEEVNEECKLVFNKNVELLTQHEASQFINRLILKWSREKENDKASTS